MRLLEAIIAANHAAVEGRRGEAAMGEFADELPLAALTCIDARLNKLFPGALGLAEEQFIWLRNAGNVITSNASSTVRSIALAVFVKGAKEIAVIGHSHCKLSKLTMMELLDRLQQHGIDRTTLGLANLTEFFGLFSSESQNVIKATGYLRASALIPAKIPVHGLLIQTDTGRLEWVVNGYETLNQPVSQPASKSGFLADAFETLLEKAQPLIAKAMEPPASPPAKPPPPPKPPLLRGRDRSVFR